MSAIAIAAESDYTPAGRFGAWYDDENLKAALEARGHRVTVIDWRDSAADLTSFDAVFVSTTWNGCDAPEAFQAWLDRCEADGRPRLINPRRVIDDGFFKYRYLSILTDMFGQEPVPGRSAYVTPSAFFISGDPPDPRVSDLAGRSLADVLAELDRNEQWSRSDIVIKPVISADGKDTFVFNRTGREIRIDDDKRDRFVVGDIDRADEWFRRIAADRDRRGAIVQTYMEGVEQGEYSLTFFNGRCSHAIRKPPLFMGDGSVRRIAVPLGDLPPEIRHFGRRVVEGMIDHYGPGMLVRCRVDLFHQNGLPVLCEFESVDPNTNIKVIADQLGQAEAEAVFDNYAAAIEAAAQCD